MIETILLAKLTGRSANAASALVGTVTYRWLGFAWEFALSFTIYQILPLGAFHPLGWIASALLAAVWSSGIECAVLRFGFHIPATRRFFSWFFLANVATAALAIITVRVKQPTV